MKRILLSTLIGAIGVAANAASINFENASLSPITVEATAATGLEAIYVLYNTNGVSATFTLPKAGEAKWYKYSNLGAGFAQEVTGTYTSGNVTTLPAVEGDMGYYVEYNGGSRFYFWVVDYSAHRLGIKSLEAAPEQECESTILNMEFTGSPIHYFTINGQQKTLDQEITVHYYNLEWDEESKFFNQVEMTKSFEQPQNVYRLYPPVLCQTEFTVTGDRFLEEWRWGQSVTSNTFYPHAVAAETEAVQENSYSTETEDGEGEASNIIGAGNEGLGGSAPAPITFYAYISDAVIHNEWQFSRDPEFNTITYRFNVQDLDYTFTEEGTTYVRYVGSNSDGSCETYSETYEVSIGTSELKCPNAFSPGASEGVNDIWKVSYRSLTSFQCHIFDRYGNLIFQFNDPSQGWDGKYKGKLVKPGVYYYVIQATGSDGKNYKKSGDINIIGYKGRFGSGTTTDTPTDTPETEE